MTLVQPTLTKDQATINFIEMVSEARWIAARELMTNDLCRWILSSRVREDKIKKYWDQMPEDIKGRIVSEWQSAAESR